MVEEEEDRALAARLFPLDSRPGPARPLSPTAERALVQAALPARRRPPWLLVAAALLLGVAGTASALLWWSGRVQELPEPALSPSNVLPPEPAPPRPAIEPAAPPARRPARTSGVRPGSTTRPAPRASASDLLREANTLRAERRWAEAEALYLRVVMRSGPGENSARSVALIAAAALRLEHLGDAAGARTFFRRAYLEDPRGALVVEALDGWSRAAAALGRQAEEVEALSILLREHPGDPAAERARRRLGELGAR